MKKFQKRNLILFLELCFIILNWISQLYFACILSLSLVLSFIGFRHSIFIEKEGKVSLTSFPFFLGSDSSNHQSSD